MQLASPYQQIFVAQNIIPQKSHEKGRGEAGEMASLRSLCPPATPKPSSAVRSTPPVVFAGRRKWAESGRRTRGVVASRLGADGSDPLLQAALRAASLRFQESLLPDPLFVDPYSGCLLSPTVSHEDLEDKCLPSLRHYRWTTKYIDDKLLALLGTMDELRQIVLLTDGMDTRPYRLSWPCSCIIFDISPQSVFNVASKKLKGTGAKIGRNCNLVHVPLESIDLQAALYKKGFSGNMPSLWAIQGLPISTLTSLKGILSLVSSSTKKGSILMGELPAFLTGTEFETKEKRHQWTDKLFMSHGFRVNVVGYNEIAKNMHLDESFDDTKNIVFSAEQLRFSDAEPHKESDEQGGGNGAPSCRPSPSIDRVWIPNPGRQMARLAADAPTKGGFSFDLCQRNEMLLKKGMHLPTFRKTGTTIVGLVFQDGVILGADTRATEGPIVADKNCEKIHYMAPNIYCCGAGTAADTEAVTDMVSSQLQLHRYATGRESRVVTALTLLKSHLFSYQGHVSAALVLGGVDVTGPHLHTVYPHGSTDTLPFATMGSGSLAAMAVFESKFREGLTKEEGIILVSEAICSGIFNDLGSGSNVDVCVITKGHTEYLRNHQLPNPRTYVSSRGYNFVKGHTGDELLSDSFLCKEIENGMLWEVEGKWVVKGAVDVDIGANPSAEGGEDEGVDDTATKVVDIVDTFRLQEQPAFDKKQFVTYIKRYIKLLTPKLDEEKQELFKKHIEGATKFLLSKLKDLQFFVGESMHDDGSLVFAYYKDGATDPTFLYFACGLKEIKC
ncbi:hypothetical protein MUK42_31055 [Musa troglodytarum]|uniref:proteasome endopeptidase complex n=1 Tax=Musa troglodytarum TaxID=320322 RepID=A0A9E7GV10_9LILI|nr:hypothetical protein MUK42_31055 [Musa troglodytarum]